MQSRERDLRGPVADPTSRRTPEERRTSAGRVNQDGDPRLGRIFFATGRSVAEVDPQPVDARCRAASRHAFKPSSGRHSIAPFARPSQARHRRGIPGEPPWRQPRGKSMVSFVNSHTNTTRTGRHLWEIDLIFACGLPPGQLHRRGVPGITHPPAAARRRPHAPARQVCS